MASALDVVHPEGKGKGKVVQTLVSTSSPNILEGLYFCSNLARSWQYKKK